MTKNKAVASIATIVGGLVLAASTASAALMVPTQSCSYSFTSNLRLGSRGEEVRNLQKVLNGNPMTMVAASGPGSKGMETTTFGPATRNAVIKFQELNAADTLAPIGATKGTGNVFALTRAVLNQVCTGNTTGGTTGTTTGPVVNGPVSVSLSASQPSQVIVAGQAAAKLADFVFTGNGTVTNVKLMRTGVSNNTTLNSVYLYDGATRLTDSASVLADGTITFNSTSGLFTVNGSKTISVRADIFGTNTSGQSVGVMLSGYTSAGASASVVSLAGNNQPIASLTLATVSLSGANVAAQSINAGQMNTNVWSQIMNVGTRAVKLNAMTFKMIGSAPTDSLANTALFVDGVKVGNTVMFDTNGRATVDLTSSPLLLQTGNHTIELRADIVKGSYRNFQISVENVADIRVEDRDVANAFITTTGAMPNQAGLITINAGNLTTSLDPAYNATQVVGGATNVEIGRYQLKAYGEDTKVTSLVILPVLSGTTPAAAGLNNVSLYVNGGQVGSSVNWTSGPLTFNNLGSSIQVPANGSVILTVKADLVTTGNVNYTAGTVNVNLVAGTTNAQGLNSQQLTGTGAVTGKSLTITSGAATFGTTAGFNAQTINQNTANVKIGSFLMQASNADSLRVTNLGVTVSGTVPNTSVNNLTVKDGSTVIGTPIGNISTGVNNFSTNLTIPASGSKTFDVYADINNATNGQTVQAAMTATYNGVTNTNTLTSTNAGVVMTVNTASLAAGSPVVNASPVSQYVTPGTMPIATFNIKSQNGTSNITKITFNLTGVTGINSLTVGGVTKGISTGATSVIVDGLNIAVPFNNSGVAIPVTANFNAVGQNQTTSNQTNVISISDIEYTSGNTTSNTGVIAGATSNSFTLVASMPTAVKGTGVYFGTGALNGAKVGTYSVTANASGDINLAQVIIAVGMPTGGNFTNPVLKQGGTQVAGSTCTVSSNTATCVFSPVFRVAAGTTATFDVFGDSTSITTAGTASVNAGAATSFLWGDTNTANNLTGTLVQNYGN